MVCADNLLTGRMENLEHLSHEPRFEFLEQDVCQAFDPAEVDYVFPLRVAASPVDCLKHGIRNSASGLYERLLARLGAVAIRWSIRRKRATGGT